MPNKKMMGIWSVKKGDRVELTERGILNFSQPHANKKATGTKGTVAGFSHDLSLIKVLRDGLKIPTRYHRSFWKVCEEEMEKESSGGLKVGGVPFEEIVDAFLKVEPSL